jgi:MFS family permease
MMGVGLLGTFLSLRLGIAGYSAQTIGFVMAAYFLGLTAGSFLSHRLIRRVGHIRAFAAFAAVTTAIVMIHGLTDSPIIWGCLRFLAGVATIGLYMVIESWLNECAEPRTRGRVLSMYMIISYLGMGIGQQLLNLGDVRGQEPFFMIGFLLAVCLVPVTVTHSLRPELPDVERFHVIELFRKAPLGMLGCLVAGLMNSAFYALGPVLGLRIGLSVSELSWFMTATIFGGLLLQWPVGLISDRFDRTRVLSVLGALMALTSLVVAMTARISFPVLVLEMVVFGGMMFTIYPVAVARTHDLFTPKDIVAVSSVLLLCYGVGAATGPVVASFVMTLTGTPFGFFAYCTAISAGYAAITFYFRRADKIVVVPVEDQVGFVPIRSTTTVATNIDPRAGTGFEPETAADGR